MKVTIKAASDGTFIHAGDKIVDEVGNQYECAHTDHYLDGAEVELREPENLIFVIRHGAPMTWVSPRPGCAAVAKVVRAVTRADFDRLEARLAAVEAVNADLLGRLERAAQMLADLPAKIGGSLKVHVTTARQSS